MKNVIAYVCVSVWVLAATSVAAQSDTVLQMADVQVTANRVENFTTGSKIDAVDSVMMVAYKHQSLADILATQSQLFIKSYGPGSLATTSFRGAASGQTAILWNGFNLQSPMNGQLELTLIQADVLDDIKIQYGSSGALFGSGAVGGTIHIGNKARFGGGWHASATAQTGSFSNNKQVVSVTYGSKRYSTSLRVLNQFSKNNFAYSNTFLAGSPEVHQTNASFNQQGILNDHYFAITNHQTINVRLWYQTAIRQIPPPMSVPTYKATQADNTLRISSEWNMQHGKATYFVRSAWFAEELVFEDSVSNNLQSHNHARTNITEVETKVNLTQNQFINIGVNNTYVSATSTGSTTDGYKGTVWQNRTALFASYKVYTPTKKWQACLSARQEMIAQKLLPIMPSVGFEWLATRHIKVFGNVSRSYRVPTLNERYWNPGGDPNLRAESGWAEEISINHHTTLYRITADITATAFNRLLDDWIQWQPVNGYWSPRNVNQVWSRGGEGALKLTMPVGKWNISYTGRVNYVLSSNEKLDNANDLSIHKQLIYVPKLNYMNQLMGTYGSFFISFNQTYTGIRYTQTDESDWVNYYLLGNVAAGKNFSIKKLQVGVNVQVNNIWNETYQVIKDRPMPGTNFLAALTLKL